jgi:hypothetical protein
VRSQAAAPLWSDQRMGVKTMVEVRGEILINRRADEVFDFVADEENEPRYNPQMRVARKMTDGPLGVGTVFQAEMRARAESGR